MPVRPDHNPKPRRGAILVIVLITMLVASMLGIALIKKVLIHRQQVHLFHGQQQSLWLAEAGIQRALRHLAEKPDYEGETWEVATDVLGPSRSAKVNIAVTRQEDLPEARTIRVAVILDDERARLVGYQRQYQYQRPTKQSKETSEQSEKETAD